MGGSNFFFLSDSAGSESINSWAIDFLLERILDPNEMIKQDMDTFYLN